MTLNPIQQNPFNTYGHISLKFASDPAVAWVCSESYRQGIYHEVSLTYIEVDHAVQMVMQLLFQQHTSEIFKDTKFVVVCCDMGPALLVSMLSTMVGGYTFIPMEATSQTKSELLHRARVLLGQNPLMILVDADFDDSLTERNTDTVRSGNPPAESSPRILNVKHVLAKISQAFIRTPSYKREDCSSPGVESCLSHGDNPCWIFYTSGSTGRPKPIAVSHREVCAYVGAAVSRYQVSAGTRWFVGTNATFDPSAGDALMTLSAGGTVCYAQWDILTADLARCVGLTQATAVGSTPSVWSLCDANVLDTFQRQLTPQRKVQVSTAGDAVCKPRSHLESKELDSTPASPWLLQTLVLGGERMPVSLAQQWAARVSALVNTYGVTEGCVYQFSHQLPKDFHRLTASQQQLQVSCVGAPLDGVDVLRVPCPVDPDIGTSTDPSNGGSAGNGHSATEAEAALPSMDSQQQWESHTGAALPVRFEIAIGGRQVARSCSVSEPNCNRCKDGCTCMWYRTGDIASVYQHGTDAVLGSREGAACYVLHGRQDHQVKIHGRRMELEDVETRLQQCASRCLVHPTTLPAWRMRSRMHTVARSAPPEDAVPRVAPRYSSVAPDSPVDTAPTAIAACAAYVESTEGTQALGIAMGVTYAFSAWEPETGGARVCEALELYLRRQFVAASQRGEIPTYVLPTHITVFDAHDPLPKTRSGKLDRRAAQAKCAVRRSARCVSGSVRACTILERRVADIWAPLLGISGEQIHPDTSLFDLGADSLMVLRIARRLRDTFADIPHGRYTVATTKETALGTDGTNCTARVGADDDGRRGVLRGAFSPAELMQHPVLSDMAHHIATHSTTARNASSERSVTPKTKSMAPLQSVNDDKELTDTATLLKLCARFGDTEPGTNGYNELLFALLRQNADPNGGVSRQAPGLTPLHVAAQHCNATAARLLLQFGANPSAVTAHRVMPTHTAAAHSAEVLRLLLEYAGTEPEHASPSKKPSIHASDASKHTLLHHAARSGNVAAIDYLAQQLGSSTSATNMHPEVGPRTTAKRAKVIRGLDMNAGDRWHRIPLHWAVLNGHLEAAERLIHHGSYVDYKIKEGQHAKRTMLDQEPIPHMAARLAADSDTRLRLLRTILALATDVRTVVNLCDGHGRTPLHVLASASEADPHGETSRSATGADATSSYGPPCNRQQRIAQVVQLLLNAGADVHATATPPAHPRAPPTAGGVTAGDTPLHQAVRHGHVAMVAVLARSLPPRIWHQCCHVNANTAGLTPVALARVLRDAQDSDTDDGVEFSMDFPAILALMTIPQFS
eukprot:m.1619890 g.1619890  ORF g.1619890 m.1619890 type:complete len:1305 (-) comp25383_c0_seq17:3507-7421(-)